MYQPVRGARISSGYTGGFRSHGKHSGIDFAAPAGSAVYAAAPGRVISVGWGGAYGNLVRVLHTDGTIGYYAHLQGASVRPGSQIVRGSMIGRVGSTGNSTGPHLHFEVRRNGKLVDPSPWLDARSPNGGGVQPGLYGGIRLNSEQLRNAQTIISVGRSMGASERDIMIGLMTAMQESSLRNLNYGDRDSLGLFQQRPSQGWGTPAQVRNPVYAARKFFTELMRIQNRDRMALTQAAQAVQRSAFPNAYAKWENLARAIMGNPNAGVIPVQPQNMFLNETLTTFRDPSEVLNSIPFADSPGGLTPQVETPATSLTEFSNPADSFVEEAIRGY